MSRTWKHQHKCCVCFSRSRMRSRGMRYVMSAVRSTTGVVLPVRYRHGHYRYADAGCADDWDRRCLMAILGRYYSPAILQDEHVLSPSGVYCAPRPGPLESVIDYVQQLPPNVTHLILRITYDNRRPRRMPRRFSACMRMPILPLRMPNPPLSSIRL
jgi:hypothetical protein